MSLYKTAGLLLVISLLSCNSKKLEQENNYILNSDGVLRFLLDSATSNNSLYLEPFFDKKANKELLVYLSKKKPSFIFFDIEKQTVAHELLLKSEGPNGVGKPTGAYIRSFDSIYVVSSYSYEISLVNMMGTRLKRFVVLEGTDYNDNTCLINPCCSPIYPINNKLHFVVYPDRSLAKLFFYEGFTNSCLDINTGQYTYLGLFPEEYKGKTWGVRGPGHSWVLNTAGNFVSSFAVPDSVIEWSVEQKLRKKYYAGTIFRKSKTMPFEKPDSGHDLDGYALETIYYEGLVYDKYRDVYYRIACLPVDVKDKDGNLNDYFNKPISIIILDKDFKIIGESKIADNTYLFYMFFVGKDGLYFAKTNPHYKGLEEDYLVFDRFTLSKK